LGSALGAYRRPVLLFLFVIGLLCRALINDEGSSQRDPDRLCLYGSGDFGQGLNRDRLAGIASGWFHSRATGVAHAGGGEASLRDSHIPYCRGPLVLSGKFR
jgi:hypothetical protein